MPRTTTSADESAATTAEAPAASAAKTARPKKVAGTKSAATTTTKQDGNAPARKPAPASARPTGGYASDENFLAHQRTLLSEERVNYVEQAKLLRAEAESLVEEMEPGDIQFDEESGEGGTVTVDRERDLALSAQALAAVEEIDAALQKIGRGTYGICEGCGETIAAARLEALPYARLCVACKSGGLSRR